MEFKDASAIAAAVRKKDISAKEIVQETIRKANALNPELNAIVSTRYEKALAEADSRDFSKQVFAGVPIYIKDLGQEMAEELSTSGSSLFQTYRSAHTNNFVKRLEELGFIILGKTNTPEFGFKNISDSKANGSVNLPADRTRNAGGSSGGSAALLSSGICTLATASDGGGSIRVPASFNALIGLKPSRGRIITGPNSYRGWQGASVHFALTKSVRDTKNLLYHLQSSQMESPFNLPLLTEKALSAFTLPKLRIAYLLKEADGSPLKTEVQNALLKARDFLISQGHELVAIDSLPVDLDTLMSAYYFMNASETAAMFDDIEAVLGRTISKSDMETMTWAIYQAGKGLLAKDYSSTLQQWDQFSLQMELFHQSYDLLLTPTTHDVAPKHGQLDPDAALMEKLAHAEEYKTSEQLDLINQMFQKGLDLNPYTPLANLTGQTAVSLPTYLTEDGLALGTQLIAGKGREDLLLAVAELFEEEQALTL
ncbi:amidase [Streptococcus catagoni]|uniref:amidase n=1 Tax=Streptococcus catagoni TaxID=2654874 RepID=UPI0014099DB4|nr:amidase [Streptococcus catagoni]